MVEDREGLPIFPEMGEIQKEGAVVGGSVFQNVVAGTRELIGMNELAKLVWEKVAVEVGQMLRSEDEAVVGNAFPWVVGVGGVQFHCDVDVVDMHLFAGDWLSPYDLTGFALLAQDWLLDCPSDPGCDW